jgi:hypothetical protein
MPISTFFNNNKILKKNIPSITYDINKKYLYLTTDSGNDTSSVVMVDSNIKTGIVFPQENPPITYTSLYFLNDSEPKLYAGGPKGSYSFTSATSAEGKI